MVKNLPANAGDTGSISGPGRSPGEGNGNRLQYSCLENPTDRGACGLQTAGSQRVRYDLVTEGQQQYIMLVYTCVCVCIFLLLVFHECMQNA